MTKLLINGNCHAQYLGAVFRALSNADVRVIGRAHPGPIHYKRTVARMIESTAEMIAWLAEDSKAKIIVLEQKTRPGQQSVSSVLSLRHIPHAVVHFPFVKFDALSLRFSMDTTPDVVARGSRRAIRSDRIFNELCFFAAGYPIDLLNDVEDLIRHEPSFHAHNHYVGKVHAVLLRPLRSSALAEAIGPENFERILEQMSCDRGIAHLNTGIPHPVVISDMKIVWLEQLRRDIAYWRTLIWREPKKALFLIRTQPIPEVLAFNIFRIAHAEYKKQKRHTEFLICLRLYRDERYFMTWACYLFDMLLDRGKPLLAYLLLLNRMTWEDSRGKLLLFALGSISHMRNCRRLTSLVEGAAKAHPKSSVNALNECLKHF